MGGGGGCCIGDCCLINCCAFDTIKRIFGGGSGGGCGYTPGPSENEIHAKKIAGELEDMKTKMRESSEAAETEIANDLMESTDSFLRELSQINNKSFGSVKLKLNMEEINKQNQKLKDSIKGTIADHMDERLILTDKELSVILEERDDKKRAKNFESFCKKTQKESIDKLKAKVKKTIEEQNELVSGEINARINELANSATETLDNLAKITGMKQAGDDKAESEKLDAEYKHEICAITNDLINT